MSAPPNPEFFRSTLLKLVNETLPQLQTGKVNVRPWSPVNETTPLFEQGRLDSLSILHLIAAIEELTGQQVPDRMVNMKHFRTIETLTQTFCHENAINAA